MAGVRQFFGRRTSRRQFVIALVLTSWAIQGVFYWSWNDQPRASAARDVSHERDSGLYSSREGALVALEEARREGREIRFSGNASRYDPD